MNDQMRMNCCGIGVAGSGLYPNQRLIHQGRRANLCEGSVICMGAFELRGQVIKRLRTNVKGQVCCLSLLSCASTTRLRCQKYLNWSTDLEDESLVRILMAST